MQQHFLQLAVTDFKIGEPATIDLPVTDYRLPVYRLPDSTFLNYLMTERF